MTEFNKPRPTVEDEAFNDIERQAKQRMAAVNAAFDEQYPTWKRNQVIEEVLQRIKELRPAIMPLEGMGRGKATQEWFDILVKDIGEMKK